MASQLDKQSLTRLAWLTELRRQGDRKCEGDYFDWNDDGEQMVCALGLLAEVAGYGSDDEMPGSTEIDQLAGLTEEQAEAVWMMNDGYTAMPGITPEVSVAKHTFAEIADVVEGWFKP
jgi:hypothetical protein